MPQVITPVDIENALRQDIVSNAGTYVLTAGAPPVPEKLGSKLPFVVIERLGGQRRDEVVDVHDVSIDVYSTTWTKAQEAAGVVAGVVASLKDCDATTVHYLDSVPSTLPYNNPDPRHQDIPRVTLSATVSVRGVIY